MLRDAWFLAVQDLKYNLRRRETMVWAFVMPIIFFYFVGTIMSGAYGPPPGGDKLAVYVPDDAGFLAGELIRHLERLDYQVIRTRSLAELKHLDRQLEIPAGMTASVLAGKPVTLELTRPSSGMDADYDRIRMSRAIAAVLAPPDAPAHSPRALTLSVERAGRRKEIPTGFEQSVPGSLVFFILMALLTNGVTLTIEREQGILRRLASSPISRGFVVLGKWGARMALGAIQVAFALLTGTVLFHVRWGAHLWAVIAILLAYAALAAVLGMLLGNFGRTQRQVIVMGAIASNLLASLGGCWWPIEVTPKWCQTLAHWIPTGIAMDALHQLMSFGAEPGAVVWQFSALVLIALAAGYVLARTFRFQ
ncbi:MAG: ABC transporter permease [Bryobacteraceae bacterium]